MFRKLLRMKVACWRPLMQANTCTSPSTEPPSPHVPAYLIVEPRAGDYNSGKRNFLSRNYRDGRPTRRVEELDVMKRTRAVKSAKAAASAQADENLVTWANKHAPWVRDALRRHATSQWYVLSDADKGAIRERVRHAAGFEFEQPPACEPLAPYHVKPTTVPDTRVVLCSLGPVKHLNRLASDQRMRFATDGLTVIFGDNGTGKSGYARVAKKMCRSLSKDDLLGNVFEPGESPPAVILVRYKFDGSDVLDVTWTDGSSSPEPLANIAFFDLANARLYVDRQNRISYLPPDISLLQRHGEHCAEMDGAFKAEVSDLQKRLEVPLPSGYTAGGTIASVLARLDPKQAHLPTAEEIKALASAESGDESEIRRLEQLLANDPAVLAAGHRRAKKALEEVHGQLTAAIAALSAEKATELQAILDQALSTAAAASLAASQRFASEPLGGVGSDPWRMMYDYARQFAAANGARADKLPDEIGAPCSMCQEPLSEAGAARMRSFNDFVADSAMQAADRARAALGESRQALQRLQIPKKAEVALALAEYASLNDSRKALAEDVADYADSALQRREALASAASTDEVAAALALKSSLAARIGSATAELDSEAKAFDAAAAYDGARASDRAKLAQLRDRKKLADELDTVLARLGDLIHMRGLTNAGRLSIQPRSRAKLPRSGAAS